MALDGLRSCFRRFMRGQGATEYLVVLGAVLLVSLVVVSATASFSSSQVSMKQQQSQSYWSSLSPIRVISSKVVYNNLVLQVQNTGTSTIRLDGVNVGGADLPFYPYYSGDYYGPAYCSRPNDNFSATMSCALIIGSGESVYVAVQGAISGSSPAVDCAGKSSVEISGVQFSYSLGGSSITNLILKGDKPIVASCGTKACDANWVKVPGNSSLLVNDFCLMKYEAKQSGVTAVSNWSGNPWVSINQTSAADRCSALGSGYHLVRDREWNAVASNVANVAANWFTANAGASSGSTCLFGGHMECASGAACCAAFNASSDDSAGWWNGTSNASVSSTATCPFVAANPGGRGYETRRTMFLSTGDVVWDLSGNVWEWTDGSVFEDKTGTGAGGYDDSDGITGGQEPFKAGVTTQGWHELTTVSNFNSLNYSNVSSWNSAKGAGQIYLSPGYAYDGSAYASTTHAFLRGGIWDGGAYAGAWALLLYTAPSCTYGNLGFRCAR